MIYISDSTTQDFIQKTSILINPITNHLAGTLGDCIYLIFTSCSKMFTYIYIYLYEFM